MSAVFHRLFQHDARTGVLVFQLFCVLLSVLLYTDAFFSLAGMLLSSLPSLICLISDLPSSLICTYTSTPSISLGGQVGKKFFNQFGFHAPGQAGNVSVTGVACQVLQSDVYRFLFRFPVFEHRIPCSLSGTFAGIDNDPAVLYPASVPMG